MSSLCASGIISSTIWGTVPPCARGGEGKREHYMLNKVNITASIMRAEHARVLKTPHEYALNHYMAGRGFGYFISGQNQVPNPPHHSLPTH
eukprot:41203-Pelagomonas_calceolata.AAC.1